MERALSFQAQLEAKLFATQEALSDAIGLSKQQVAKLVKAAGLMRQATIAQLLPTRAPCRWMRLTSWPRAKGFAWRQHAAAAALIRRLFQF